LLPRLAGEDYFMGIKVAKAHLYQQHCC